MAGLYLHIPFCRKACNYCDFHFSTSMGARSRVLAAMHRELEARSGEVDGPFGTVYFGGGTPSLLEQDEITGFMRVIHERQGVEPGAEITLETNPDDITPDRLAMWKELGITRISLGTQSFRDERLKWMGRAHDARQAMDSIALIAGAGFASWTIDLIYGLPGMTTAEWDEQLTIALDHGMPHLSAYCLTVEARTALDHQVRLGLLRMPDDVDQSAQFDRLMDRMAQAGLEQYEISNFGRAGHRSRHNAAYWEGVPYLGAGPSAHSYDGRSRRWNLAHNLRYAQAIERGDPWWDEEELTPAKRTNELLMTGLRTIAGVRTDQLEIDALRVNKGLLRKHLDQGNLTLEGGRLALTRAGRHHADRIASDLFVTDDDR
ncbi:MAG: radical SAM family heme chaperone HemW [Flavobacteriales bacterium]|nr:radical SAM family heme chaperone HemW [Flavobacteriales bacterium]